MSQQSPNPWRRQARGLIAYARLQTLTWKIKSGVKPGRLAASASKPAKPSVASALRAIRLSSRPF